MASNSRHNHRRLDRHIPPMVLRTHPLLRRRVLLLHRLLHALLHLLLPLLQLTSFTPASTTRSVQPALPVPVRRTATVHRRSAIRTIRRPEQRRLS